MERDREYRAEGSIFSYLKVLSSHIHEGNETTNCSIRMASSRIKLHMRLFKG
jgi:hypothetical protein